MIKFRAWDKKRECMTSADDPDLVLMQYTGLKDKNGIPVFEGDTVTYGDKVGVIQRIDGEARFGIPDDPDFSFKEDTEVIGNTYEGAIPEA